MTSTSGLTIEDSKPVASGMSDTANTDNGTASCHNNATAGFATGPRTTNAAGFAVGANNAFGTNNATTRFASGPVSAGFAFGAPTNNTFGGTTNSATPVDLHLELLLTIPMPNRSDPTRRTL